MNISNPKSSEEALYEQALVSLKELNDEVFLNRFRKELTEAIISIQNEIDDLSVEIKREQKNVGAAIKHMNHVVEGANNQSISSVQNMVQDVQTYFQSFSAEYNNGVERVRDLISQSNELSKGLIDSYVAKHEKRFIMAQERHEIEHGRLKTVVTEIGEHVSVLEELHRLWLELLNDFKNSMAEQRVTFERNNENQRNLLITTEEKLLCQINQLEEKIVKTDREQRDSAEMHKMNWQSALKEQSRAFEKIEEQLTGRVSEMEDAINQFTNEHRGWEIAINDQKKVWENEWIERTETDLINRIQVVEELKNAHRQLALQTIQELQTENNQLNARYDTLAKQNHLFLGGLIFLSAIQIILHFI
ncbi:hypothetical protein [Exiguobacterium aurantiacum]|uniref:hypothetical protein n=1 Tax=Exiguobacterium aurantiacum TaxID=33987 RepID=UPI0008779CB1|nr:hypothetical protein [Exiguobacterium aurantiacum]